MNGTRWKFGRGQSYKEEGREIAEAKRAGLVEAYMRGQWWAKTIERERHARHSAEHKLRYYR
jgi:hypothetical protein